MDNGWTLLLEEMDGDTTLADLGLTSLVDDDLLGSAAEVSETHAPTARAQRSCPPSASQATVPGKHGKRAARFY